MIRKQGSDPARIGSPESAWRAFLDFLTVEFDGLETEPDCDADGFIVQWGRNNWNNDLPSLTFTRHFAVDVRAGCADTQDSGFYFERPGPGMDEALREALWEFGQFPALQALWASTPLRSAVVLDQAG